jgi:hypothetical protein
VIKASGSFVFFFLGVVATEKNFSYGSEWATAEKSGSVNRVNLSFEEFLGLAE